MRLVGTTDNASGIVLNPDIRLGYDFGLWYLPQNLTSSTYRFTLSGTYISLTTPVLQLRLVELNTQSVWQWQYALAFTADLFYEAIGTYPSFTGANLYPVMTTGFTPSSSVSITVLSAINQSIILDNQQFISRPNCFYDKVLQTPWKCSSPNELYYATVSLSYQFFLIRLL